jgi:hypothetical protein
MPLSLCVVDVAPDSAVAHRLLGRFAGRAMTAAHLLCQTGSRLPTHGFRTATKLLTILR